jgi:hypothetical protein
MAMAHIMRRLGLTAALGCLIAWPAAAQENVTINVNHEAALGRVTINGVPVLRFDSAPRTPDSGPPTAIVNGGMWMNDGSNEIVVEVKSKGPGSNVRVVLMKSMDGPPLLDSTVKGSDGRIVQAVTLQGLPHWAWLDSEPWTGDPRAVVEAVKALHAALDKKDVLAHDAMRKALEEDMGRVMGPMPDAVRKEIHDSIRNSKVFPLPADLKVSSHYGNRLFVVTDADGAPPVRLREDGAPDDEIIETGQYWIRKGGTWQVVR